jgi:hypothetical protein
MSTLRHREKKRMQRKQKQRKIRQAKSERRRKKIRRVEDKREEQSRLSKRWMREAPERGRLAKLEAIYTIQDQTEQGKKVTDSLENLAKLIGDKDKEVSIAATFAAGICAKNGENPTAFIPNLIKILRPKDDLDEENPSGDHEIPADLIVETAIETLAECAKHANQHSRAMLIKKLLNIERNGVDSQTKADAGFALAQIVQDVPEISLDKKMRGDSHLAFLKLTESEDDACKLAGTWGFCSLGLQMAKASQTPAQMKESVTILSTIPTTGDVDVYSTAIAVYESALAYLDHEHSIMLYNSALTMMFAAPDIPSLEEVTGFIRDGLFDKKMRLPLINGLAYWQKVGVSSLLQHNMSVQAIKLLRSGVAPEKIIDSMEFEKEDQRTWMQNQIEFGKRTNSVEDALLLGALTKEQLNLALVKMHAFRILREQGLKIATDETKQLMTILFK